MAEQTDYAAIHAAARDGDIQQVRDLLQSGVGVDAKDPMKRTPLIKAAINGHVDLVRLLIDAGADVNARERAHPLEEGRRTALFCACVRSGSQGLRIAEMLLEAGANPNTASSIHVPLTIACANGNLSLVRLLLKHGADPNGHEKFYGPLANAAQNAHFKNQVQIVRELVAHGADPNRGGPPICLTDSVEMTKVLLECGADINGRDSDGQTALHHNYRVGSLELIRTYIDAGIDVNAKDNNEMDPLALICGVPRIEVAELLVKAGADVNTSYRAGYTVLDHIVNCMPDRVPEDSVSKQAAVEFLRSKGAKTRAEIKAEKRKQRS